MTADGFCSLALTKSYATPRPSHALRVWATPVASASTGSNAAPAFLIFENSHCLARLQVARLAATNKVSCLALWGAPRYPRFFIILIPITLSTNQLTRQTTIIIINI